MLLPSARMLVLLALIVACMGVGLMASRDATAGPVTNFEVDRADDAFFDQCSAIVANDCTWRGAMSKANSNANASSIEFRIPGSGVQTIHVAGQVDYLFNEVTIDGTTQQEVATPGTCTVQQGGPPCIVLDGDDPNFADDAIVGQDGSQLLIKGLAIVDFASAIWLADGAAHVITGNYIGTRDGVASNEGNVRGIYVESSVTGVTIGGTETIDRNIISANGVGILATGAFGMTVEGNYIGTTASGNAGLANASQGIFMNGAEHSVIGGTDAGAGNVISGNGGAGIQIDLALDIAVQGNYIGTNALGTAALPNAVAGVAIDLSSFIAIGGGTASARNVISGNGGVGLLVKKSIDTTVQGNYIGVNANGNAAIPNTSGIEVDRSTATLIGGDQTSLRNVISGNLERGVKIVGAAPAGTVVTGNYIGVNATGTSAVGNLVGGVLIHTSAGNDTKNNTVHDNVISGNMFSGVYLLANVANTVVSGNSLYGNMIGLNAAGTARVPNGQDGVKMEGTTGGTVQLNNIGVSGQDPNIISGNGHDGIAVLRNTIDNTLTNNIIGTNAHTAAGLGNGQTGVNVNDPPSIGNTITQNSIDYNVDIGISLTNGGNGQIPAPVLAAGPNVSTPITGTITGPPNTQFTIEFFSSPVCDPSGFGEGRHYISSTGANAGISGTAEFTLNSAPDAQQVTATATDSDGTTSEFSNCVTPSVTPPTPSPTPSPTPTPTPSPTPTPTPTPSPTPTPTGGAGLRGDADCDGAIDLDDVIAALSEFASVDPGAPCDDRADVDCDGDVDGEDALRILLHVAGTPKTPPGGCGPIGGAA